MGTESSDKDYKMIRDELVPGLEQQEPYFRLYLEYRDGIVGNIIMNNIHNAIEKSRRVIIFLTEDFLKVGSIGLVLYPPGCPVVGHPEFTGHLEVRSPCDP